MSESLVRKGLQIVDPQYDNKKGKKRNKSEVFQLAPQNQKIFTKGFSKEGKGIKINLLSVERKLTVAKARNKNKPKDQILKENLRKLELIQDTSKVELDEKIVRKIIDRAVSRRPVKAVNLRKQKKTAFTEEDFKKFEEEYFDE